MRLALGLFLMLAGAGIMLLGIVQALLQLSSLYQGAIDHPLDQPEGAEMAIRAGMLHWVGIGAIGVVPFLIGLVLFKGEVARRLRRRMQRSATPRTPKPE